MMMMMMMIIYIYIYMYFSYIFFEQFLMKHKIMQVYHSSYSPHIVLRDDLFS